MLAVQLQASAYGVCLAMAAQKVFFGIIIEMKGCSKFFLND
jgi:hypothetical protein